MNIDPIRAAIAPYALLIKAGALVAAVLLVFALGWNRGADRWHGKYEGERRAHAATRAQHAATLRRLAEQTAAVARKAKAASVQVKADRKAADDKLKDATHEAKRNAAALAAALRAGQQRLSSTWACPAAGSAAGGAAGDAGQAAAARQYDSAARIVAAADADAAVIGWLWDSWKADRSAVIAAGCAVEAAR
jgi:hypothetical protein